MPAYLMAMMDIHDGARYEAYKQQAPALVAKHGGTYLVRGGRTDIVEGGWPGGRTAVLEFPDYAAAKSFVDDPDYRPVAAIRHAAATSHLWLVDGVPGGPSGKGMHGFVLGRIRIADAEAYRGYAEQVPGVLARLGGTYLARGGQCEAVEGGMDLDRLVIVGFADFAAAKTFHASEAYAPLIAVRSSASNSNVVIAAGL